MKINDDTKQNLNESKENLNIFQLSDQAVGAVMLALQNSLLNQTDIVPTLKGLKLVHHPHDGLIVTNPPIIRTGQTHLDRPEQTIITSVQ